MSQNQQFKSAPRKKTILGDYRQPLPKSDAPVGGGKYPAQLKWEQKNNGNIILKVDDGVWQENAKGNHKEVEMSWGDRGELFEALLEAASDPLFGTRQLAIRKKQFIFQPGGSRMSDQPIVQCYLTISRTEKGISLGYSKGDYRVVFNFRGSNDNTVFGKDANGERFEDHGMMSRWSVKGYVGFHRPVLDQMEVAGWEPPKPKGDAPGFSGGQGGAQRNNNYQNGGGQQRQSAPPVDDFADDIPF